MLWILNYIDAITSTILKKRKGRAEFQRGISYIKNGKRFVKGVGSQGSGILSSMSRANCLIYLDDNTKNQKNTEKTNENYLLGIATNKSRIALNNGLKKHELTDLFDITLSTEEANPKPDPDMAQI